MTNPKTVSDFLPMVKANGKTYYNLTEQQKKDFKNLYNYLVKHKEKQVSFFVERVVAEIFVKKDIDFLKKYKAMEAISNSIKH